MRIFHLDGYPLNDQPTLYRAEQVSNTSFKAETEEQNEDRASEVYFVFILHQAFADPGE